MSTPRPHGFRLHAVQEVLGALVQLDHVAPDLYRLMFGEACVSVLRGEEERLLLIDRAERQEGQR